MAILKGSVPAANIFPFRHCVWLAPRRTKIFAPLFIDWKSGRIRGQLLKVKDPSTPLRSARDDVLRRYSSRPGSMTNNYGIAPFCIYYALALCIINVHLMN